MEIEKESKWSSLPWIKIHEFEVLPSIKRRKSMEDISDTSSVIESVIPLDTKRNREIARELTKN